MALVKPEILSNLTTRQKVTAGIFAVVVLILLWQVVGLFRGETPPSPAPGAKPMVPGAPGMIAQPAPAHLQPKTPTASPREAELMKLQQETEAKYLSALNELQTLKLAREIAETNQAIMNARLATVKAEKNIVDLLTKPAAPQLPPQAYAPALVSPATPSAVSPPTPVQQAPAVISPPAEVKYVVISVSQIQYKWSAVLGYQDKLYNVAVGDVLPLDSSKVVSIDRTGVVLQKDGAKKKISMVSAI